jgi:diguanylate cyclase (GGDEF)-like protein
VDLGWTRAEFALRSGRARPITGGVERILDVPPGRVNEVVGVAWTAPTASELLIQAQAHVDRSDTRTAKMLATDALTPRRSGGDRGIRARALTIVAVCDRLEDRYPESMAAGLAAIELCREIGDLAIEARARSAVARVLLVVGETDEAVKESHLALDAAESSGDLTSCMTALITLGTVCITTSHFELALAYCERASETARMISDEVAVGALMDTTACAYLGQADEARASGDVVGAAALYKRATELSGQAMLVARRHGHRRFEATALANLAEGLAAIGEEEEALRLLESWRTDPDLDTAYTITHHLDTRGGICLALGRYRQATELFAAALASAEGKNAAMLYHEHLADAYERSGDPARALAHYKEFHALFKQVASESAQRGASVAAVRWETVHAKALAERERVRAEALSNTNIELSRRADDLWQQSQEDPLTGLANRRAMDQLLEAGLSNRTIALLDVDHFKKVNDTFSHLVGDEVLRRLGRILRESRRAGDAAVRYGGEEFAILLHDVGEQAARTAAERLRVAVETFDWNAVAEGLAVTVSIGVAHGAEAASVADVLTLADRRLYAAKRGGRNRVIHADLP